MANTKVKAEQLEAAQTNITSVGTLTGLTGGTGDLIWDTPTFVVDSSANKVGIGTNSPSYSLTVEKSVTGDWLSRIYNTGTAEGDLGVLIRTGSEHDGTSILSLYSGSSYKFKFQADGKLGVGTNSPSAGFHIEQTADGTGLSGQEINTAYFHNQEATAGHNYGVRIKAGSNATDYALRVDTLSTNGVFEVEGTGKVGIGDTSPFSKLHVEDTGWSSGSPYGNVVYIQGGAVNDLNWGHLLVSQSGTTTDTGGRISLGANGENPIVGIRAKYKGATYGDLALLTRPSGGTNTERMVIASNGNITINEALLVGTDTAYDKLAVLRTSTSQTAGMTLLNTQNGGYGSGITWESKRSDANNIQTAARLSVQGWNSWNSDSTSSSSMIFHVRHSNSLDEVMRIGSNQLIVGSSTTSYTDTTKNIVYKSGGMANIYSMSSTNEWWIMNNLQSNSGYTTKIDFRTQNTSRGYIGITGSTVQYYGNSDYRLKENYKYDFDATSLIKAMKPLQFTWKDEPMRGTQTGFLAHELKEICPYVVEGEKDAMREDDESLIRPQVVDQGKLVAVLTKALQEAITRIEALEAK